MKISRVNSWVLRVPYKFPLLKETFYDLWAYLEIETDTGITGYAMASYPMRNAIRDFINHEAAPAIIGMDPIRTEDVRTTLYWALSRKYFVGTWSEAASLIDIALWDIKGKATGQPVWKLLGGAHRRVPVYITFGLKEYSKEELVEVAKMLLADGQDKLKMVVGKENIEYEWANKYEWTYMDSDIPRDVERVRAVREAVGDKVALMVDGNTMLSYTQAFRLAKQLEPYNLTWFEDPLLQGDPRSMAHLRKEIAIPLASGSSGATDLLYFREYLLHEACDIVQPNVCNIGGFTGGLKAAALAQAFNVTMANGGNKPHYNMHLHAGVANGGWVEFHWRGWHIVQSLCDGTPSPVKGWVTLPELPGLGFTPKAGIVKEFAVDWEK